jgi:hypothetical protein
MRRTSEAEELVAMYPSWPSPSTRTGSCTPLGSRRRNFGHPELAGEPRFWGLTYSQRVPASHAGGGAPVDPRVEAIRSTARRSPP